MHRALNRPSEARAIPSGLWSPGDQLKVRGALSDLLHEFIVLVDENKALRAARGVTP